MVRAEIIDWRPARVRRSVLSRLNGGSVGAAAGSGDRQPARILLGGQAAWVAATRAVCETLLTPGE
jgi:hypothetical protein